MIMRTTINITIAREYQIKGPPIIPVDFSATKILIKRIAINRT